MIRVLFFLLAALRCRFRRKACGTEDLIDTLSDADRARLDALVAPHPYPEGNFWTRREGRLYRHRGRHHPYPRPAVVAASSKTVRPALEQRRPPDPRILGHDEEGIQRLVADKPGMFFITEGPDPDRPS